MTDLYASLAAATRLAFAPQPARSVGGSFDPCYEWHAASGPHFVKAGPSARLDAFEAEADGLRAIAETAALRVPEVLACGAAGAYAFLVLEWIDLHPSTPRSDARLGEALAMLHRCSAPRFGWHRDNTIGATPQRNGFDHDWVRFFATRRLLPQLEFAAGRGYGGDLQDRGRLLAESCGAFFSSYAPPPALLHGDLWSGNRGCDADGQPVVYDPAVYYGDREADIAMTRLFGAFDPAFYTAYQSAWALDQAAGTRRSLYNLYHLLNHLNLFGAQYLAPARAQVDSLLALLGR